MTDKTHKTADEWVQEAELQLGTFLHWLEGGHVALTDQEQREVLHGLEQVEQQVTALRQRLAAYRDGLGDAE